MTQQREPGVVEMVREIQAAPARVYRALTDAKQLLQWWGAHARASRAPGKPGSNLVGAHVDLRAGGRYRLDFRMPDGSDAYLEGEFRILDPPRRIVQTWFTGKFAEMETIVEFRLEPTPSGGTRLTLRHSGLTSAEACKDHELGWIEALGLLSGWLIAAASILASTQTGGKED